VALGEGEPRGGGEMRFGKASQMMLSGSFPEKKKTTPFQERRDEKEVFQSLLKKKKRSSLMTRWQKREVGWQFYFERRWGLKRRREEKPRPSNQKRRKRGGLRIVGERQGGAA